MFRFTCSVALQEGRGAAGKYHWRVWGALAVFRPHRVCPCSHVCAFPVYTAQAPGCSIGSGPCVACSSFSGIPQKHGLGLACVLCLTHLSSSATRSLTGALSPDAVHLLPSAVPDSVSARASWVRVPCVSSGKLASSRDLPSGCQPSRISGSLWLETRSLFALW